MQTNDKQIRDYSAVLAAQYGEHGTKQRAKFDEEAYSFYTSQIILQARKEAKVSQAELAERIGSDKSYISRVERGITMPNVSTFYRIIAALGLRVEIAKSI